MRLHNSTSSWATGSSFETPKTKLMVPPFTYGAFDSGASTGTLSLLGSSASEAPRLRRSLRRLADPDLARLSPPGVTPSTSSTAGRGGAPPAAAAAAPATPKTAAAPTTRRAAAGSALPADAVDTADAGSGGSDGCADALAAAAENPDDPVGCMPASSTLRSFASGGAPPAYPCAAIPRVTVFKATRTTPVLAVRTTSRPSPEAANRAS